ncbi:MAG: phosphopantothenoylcysteine decarboxylase [Candidatus Omnitrophica bacterium]|nr:phosphopantothenoylcysteine decarboxylase [Candidatus Omnitrophota bacterium]
MKILITAGPTWIKLDSVRILTTIFTGNTGAYCAKYFKDRGARVTLLVNPHCLAVNRKIHLRGIKIIPFHYFEEFKTRITRELKQSHFDAIIHSAAVSDYTFTRAFAGKIPSGKSALTLHLKPSQKIITLMRLRAPDSILVQFKLEIKRKGLIEKAYRSLKGNKSDFVVANALEDLKTGYKAFLLDRSKRCIALDSKKALCDILYRIILNTRTREKR